MMEKFAWEFYPTCLLPFEPDATTDAHFPKVYRRVFAVRTHMLVAAIGFEPTPRRTGS